MGGGGGGGKGYKEESYFEANAQLKSYEEILLVHTQPLMMMLYGRPCIMLLLYRRFLKKQKILFGWW